MGTPLTTEKDAIWLENQRTQKWVRMIGKQPEDWKMSGFHASLLDECRT